MQQRYSKRYDSENRRWVVVDAFLFYKVLSTHASEAGADEDVSTRHEQWKRYGNAAGQIQKLHSISSRTISFVGGQGRNELRQSTE